jgi:tRNA (guanine37-N1)-methyltransferase
MTKHKVQIISVFPGIFTSFLETSLIEKAQTKGIISISTCPLREYADPPHYHVDDSPFGGGAGMVLKPEPLSRAIESCKKILPQAKVILLSANGERFNQSKAQSISQLSEVIYVCGRYEGIDQRVIETFVDQELSIGDYVLMGGEVAAMVVIEASVRLITDVLGNPESIDHESFSRNSQGNLLEGPHYTRPAEFRGQSVPEELLSGDHAKIAQWRELTSLEKTKKVRPDLLLKHKSSKKDGEI